MLWCTPPPPLPRSAMSPFSPASPLKHPDILLGYRFCFFLRQQQRQQQQQTGCRTQLGLNALAKTSHSAPLQSEPSVTILPLGPDHGEMHGLGAQKFQSKSSFMTLLSLGVPAQFNIMNLAKNTLPDIITDRAVIREPLPKATGTHNHSVARFTPSIGWRFTQEA